MQPNKILFINLFHKTYKEEGILVMLNIKSQIIYL